VLPWWNAPDRRAPCLNPLWVLSSRNLRRRGSPFALRLFRDFSARSALSCGDCGQFGRMQLSKPPSWDTSGPRAPRYPRLTCARASVTPAVSPGNREHGQQADAAARELEEHVRDGQELYQSYGGERCLAYLRAALGIRGAGGWRARRRRASPTSSHPSKVPTPSITPF
jgi:hypothetical protein